MDEAENIKDHVAGGDRSRVAGAEPVTIKATVSAWISNTSNPTTVMEGTPIEMVNSMIFYGAADREKFGDWIRVGEADVTVRLLPRDEQVALAVKSLKAQLDQARAEWLTKQQEILAQINSLQALTMEVA